MEIFMNFHFFLCSQQCCLGDEKHYVFESHRPHFCRIDKNKHRKTELPSGSLSNFSKEHMTYDAVIIRIYFRSSHPHVSFKIANERQNAFLISASSVIAPINLLKRGLHAFFNKRHVFSTQPQCCLTFP